MSISRLLTEFLRINGHIFRFIFQLTFGAVLLEAKSSGRLYLTSECYLHFLEDELPVLLEDIPLHIR